MQYTPTAAHWKLARRYGKLPFRSPVDEVLAEMMCTVFSEEEARLAAVFPVLPATAVTLRKRWGGEAQEVERLLRAMDGRGVIGSYGVGDDRKFMLLPIVPGLFELVMWSRRTDDKARRFAELYERYYRREYFTAKPPGVVKIIPVEKHIDARVGVLPTDRVSSLIDSHESFSLAACCCRHSAELRGNPCSKPSEVCMAFGSFADFLVERNLARRAEKSEMFEAAQAAVEAGLVHLTDNVASANFLCSCCSCCCTGLKIITRFDFPWMIAKSRYRIEVEAEGCRRCGVCVTRCPTGALELSDSGLKVDEDRCIGCGVCVSGCERESVLRLVERDDYRPPNETVGQLAADCGLQAFGPMRMVAERYPTAYRRLRDVVERRFEREPT